MENTEEKIEEVLLVSSMNDIIINQICAILNDNNIPFIKSDEGSGSYMNVYMGFSNQEKRIIVSKEDYDRAMELIHPVITSKEEEGLEEDELPEELREYPEENNNKEEKELEENSIKAHKMLRHVLVFLFLIIPSIFALIAMIIVNVL